MSTVWLARGEEHLPQGLHWLSELERTRVQSLPYTKRRQEYLVARWTLKTAVAAAVGFRTDERSLARVEARHASDGAPELYIAGTTAAYDVSLTDRAGWAVCALAPVGTGLGVDLELVEPRSASFVSDYFTEPEQRIVAAADDVLPDGHDLAANLIWSAKESALKVLRTGLRRDTRSVEVSLADLAGPHGTWLRFVARTAEGELFDGWWRRSGAFVLTTCARRAQSAPLSLELPPALDSAEPAHTWLTRPKEA